MKILISGRIARDSLVSLIEHKTHVDYNVCMQIFRYMVYIWDSYEKEAVAALIAAGIKKYEFRTWKTNYRGEILIHAGKGVDKRVMKKFEEYGLEYPAGCIIAKAKLVDCIKVDEEFRSVLAQKNLKVYSSIIKHTEWEGYAFQLEDVEVLEPIPAMGKLSIWEMDWVPQNKNVGSIDFSTITACGECCVGCKKKEAGTCMCCNSGFFG